MLLACRSAWIEGGILQAASPGHRPALYLLLMADLSFSSLETVAQIPPRKRRLILVLGRVLLYLWLLEPCSVLPMELYPAEMDVLLSVPLTAVVWSGLLAARPLLVPPRPQLLSAFCLSRDVLGRLHSASFSAHA